MRLVQVQSKKYSVTKNRKRNFRPKAVVWAFVVLIVFQLVRPLPDASVNLELPPVAATSKPELAWPSKGQAALSAKGFGILATHGSQQPLATASIAKVITALCVLEKFPLKPGEAGPLITIGAADVGFYQQQVEQNGSRLPVYEGEQLSEYQAIQAIMIPSANNIADTLALWAFKSSTAYQAYANDFVLRHGLVHTHVGSDASGYDPSTTSTAEDMARLGLIAMQNPTLMAIAGQERAVFPYAGEFSNYNTALGSYGITGLKTGNNDQNPGGLLFTADVPIDHETVQVSGAVIGAASLSEAILLAKNLVESTAKNFSSYNYIQKDQQVGIITTKWGASSALVASTPIKLIRWRSLPIVKRETTQDHAEWGRAGSLGAISIQSGETQHSSTVILKEPVPGPSFLWRLQRIR
ncbi:hypothetical protein JNM87_03720 [Candidatus Saccharibacteria bacterium]|nr:hypothetical protein [Candidatus Saccharibacteria bacterium]